MLKANFLEISVLFSIVLTLLFSSNCEVSITPSIEGREGETLNLTVTWTDETFIQAKIDKLGLYNIVTNDHDVIYRQLCVTDSNKQECYCTDTTKININASCSSKSIIWTFTSLEIRNNGIHRIELTGSGDKIVKTVTVRVFAKPSDISLNCQQDNCSNIVTCQCQASAGNPKSRLHWMLQTVDGDNKDLSNHTNTDDFDIFGDIRSNLTYRVEVEDHGGSVSCVVENQLDSIRRKSVKLHFYYEPTILSPNNSILIFKESLSIHIKCEVSKVFVSNLFWIYPNTTQSKSDLLFISKLSKHDAGNYTCYASNCLGNATNQLQIVVQDIDPSLPAGVIAGIVIACLLVIGLIIFLIIYFVKIKPKKTSLKYKSQNGHNPTEFNMSNDVIRAYPDLNSESQYENIKTDQANGHSNKAFDSAKGIHNHNSRISNEYDNDDTIFSTTSQATRPSSVYDNLENIGDKAFTTPKLPDDATPAKFPENTEDDYDEHIYAMPSKPSKP